MSKGGFSVSAANRGLPRRAMVLDHAQSKPNTCVSRVRTSVALMGRFYIDACQTTLLSAHAQKVLPQQLWNL